MSRDSGRRLTPEEREQIITLRLQGVSVRAVAAQVDTSTKSVVAVTKTFLAERAAAFSAKTDATLNKLVTRHLAAADAAAVAAERAFELDDHATAAKYLAEERARLQEVAKLSGLYIERVEQSGGFTVVRIVEETPSEDE
jgi:transposase-like protein